MSDFAFTPQSVTITKNQYVTWQNGAAQPHTTTSDAGLWNVSVGAGAKSGAVYFANPGSFTYHCTIHPTMTGTIVVTP